MPTKNVILIDFETRSMKSLDKLSPWRYSKDPSTIALCMAYKINNAETRVIDFRDGYEIPSDLQSAIQEGALLEAFNILFDYFIWSNILSERHNWPRIDISNIRCTQARAMQFSLPRSLEKVSEALGIGEGKDDEGRRIMLQMCKPKKPSKKDPSIWYDDDARYERLIKYCKQDVDLTYKIRQKLISLTKEKNYYIKKASAYKNKELEVFKLNNKINMRGIKCNIAAAKHALELVEIHEEKLHTRLKEITNGRIESSNQVTEIVKYFHESKIHIPSLNKDDVEKWIPRTKGIFKEILEIRQQLGKASVKKLQAIIDKADVEDSRLRDTIVYYGASRTGRFSGQGAQVHNIIAPSLKPEEIDEAFEMLESKKSYEEFAERFPDFLDAISSCVRGMLIPAQNKVFVDSDFSAIEARVLFWLAQDELGLELYRQGKDIYKDMASAIYDKPVDKITSKNRQLGKTAILGLGYGMGKPKFLDTCANQKVEITKELADKAVNTYRERYFEVTKFWKDVERCFITAMLNPGKIIKLRNLNFVMGKDFLFIILPSGRALSYHMPDVIDQGWKKEITYLGGKKYKRTSTWGGKLVENCFAGDTKVLTKSGLKRIDSIIKEDRVWDGYDFVEHKGVISRGKKEVMNWRGIKVTQDHLIHDGSSWKKVMQLDEESSSDALRLGQNLALLQLFQQLMVEMQKLPANVIVEALQLLKQNNSLNLKSSVVNVGIREQEKIEKLKTKLSTYVDRTQSCDPFTCIDILELYQGVTISNAKLIRTTEVEELVCVTSGEETSLTLLDILRSLITLKIEQQTLTELTTMEIMNPEMYDLLNVLQIATIEGEVNFMISEEKELQLNNSYANTLLAGNLTTLLSTILKKDEHLKILPRYTKESMEVFDILNCGPNHHFCVFNSSGSVILAHNCVQATARDIMAEAMLRIDEAYPIVFTVHDQLVCESFKEDSSIEVFNNLMVEVPIWAEGCPIEAETKICRRFEK